ncbi:MAG: FHA domain-containing protein [Jatrophihabitans sp.]
MIGSQMALLAPLDPGSPVVSRCWELIDTASDIDVVVEALTREGLRSMPAFALARWSTGQLEVVVRGAAQVCTPDDAITASGISTWVERVIEPLPDTVVLRSTADSAGPLLSVNGGIVLADSLTVTTLTPGTAADAEQPATSRPTSESFEAPEPADAPATVPPSPPAAALEPVALAPEVANSGPVIEEVPWHADPNAGPAPLPDAPPAQPQAAPYEEANNHSPEGETINRAAVDAAAPQPTGMPQAGSTDGPMVPAAVCPYGHLNPPYAAYCRVCGTAVPPQEMVMTQRPLLGILRLSTGDIVPLDRGVIMGRNPRVDERDPRGPHVVKLPSPTNDISRSHVEVLLDDWHVVVADLNSTNGTTVTPPGQQPIRLRPHEPIPIEPNTEVNLADEVVFRFEVTE